MASPKRSSRKRRICFVTGTRAEFGLMRTTLESIRNHPQLHLQVVATGMHLDRSRGYSLKQIVSDGFKVDGIVAWPAHAESATGTAKRTGIAMAKLAGTFERLASDVVLVVGDRVEAFAAASAGAISGRLVAHVHGGDRALGQLDDSLRHAITKLAHVHFAATQESRQRLLHLGEEPARVHRVGAPGIDGIAAIAASIAEIESAFDVRRKNFALVIHHPASENELAEFRTCRLIAREVERLNVDRILAICPNNDPGAAGIMRCLNQLGTANDSRWKIIQDVPRAQFLGLLRDASMLVGNSSSGIIEAASFSTPVLDVGPRQLGRERSGNVVHVEANAMAIRRAVTKMQRFATEKVRNVYGGNGTGRRIAAILAKIKLDDRARRKLITY